VNVITGEDDKKWSSASLRIFSETREIDEIEGMLGVAATRSYRKGQPISSRNPGVLRRVSAWILKSPLSDEEPLASHLKWLVDVVEPRIDVLKALEANCKIDFFCGFSSANGQGGTTLDSGILERLGKIHLDLTIDLYPPGPIADEEISVADGP